jgi:tetratricopeptide (TPR) repeat protein
MNFKTIKLAAVATIMSYASFAQSIGSPAPSPLQTVKQAFATSDITLEYSRPSAKGRTVFGDVVSYGQVWRTGANGSTKVTFADDVKLNGNDVKAGTYAMYSMPNADSWDIMLYKDLKLGGNVADYNAENEVLRFQVKPTRINDKVETFTIAFNNITPTSTNLDLMWENTKVSIPVTAEIDSKIMKNIENNVMKDNRPYYSAATYYYDNNKDLGQAMTWVNKAIEANKSAYWIYMLKAKIAKKQNNIPEAIAAARESNRLATEDKDDAYINQSADMLLQLMKKK